MRKSILVSGYAPDDFAKEYNLAVQKLAGCEIVSERFINDTSCYIFYEDPNEDVSDEVLEQIRKDAEEMFKADFSIDARDPEEETEPAKVIKVILTVGAPRGRFCCECGNFSWSNGCPFRDDHVHRMSAACELFDIFFGRGCHR